MGKRTEHVEKALVSWRLDVHRGRDQLLKAAARPQEAVRRRASSRAPHGAHARRLEPREELLRAVGGLLKPATRRWGG